ncbi:MAG: tRNA dihydrouridine synthase DusB [Rhabdochlamydiaceae bacterium]
MSETFLKTPFFLGDLELPSNIFCAPLAGCSDISFRHMMKVYRPGLVYCEMVKMDALVRHDPHTFRLLDYDKDLHPIGAQLCGSKKELAGPCAKIIESLGFDVIDLNCGCPVDKVTKDGSGSGLLKNPELIGEILHEMVRSVKIPVTVKIRLGWDHNSINAYEIAQIAEKAGAKAICIHGRTRSQGYVGPANWDPIKEIKENVKQIKVIANGDIFDHVKALQAFETTKCDAILLARGTFGQPWIVDDIYRFLKGENIIKKTASDYKRSMIHHLNLIQSYQVPRKALLDMRRVCCWYLKKIIGAKKLRESLNHCKNFDEAFTYINDFNWDEAEVNSTISCDYNQ